MRIVKIKIEDIKYTPSAYDEILKESIKRIGLSFPIKVNQYQSHYQCVDGNKRLTILNELEIKEVNCIIMDNGNSRSNDCWRGRNHH